MTSVKKVLLPFALAATLAACTQAGAGSLDGVFGPRASRTQLAFAALAEGDFVQAQSQADQALALDADDPHALYARAVALRYSGRERDAAEILSRLMESERAQQAPIAGGAWNAMAPTTVARLARQQLESMNVAATLPTTLTPPSPAVVPAVVEQAAPAGAAPVAAMGAPTEPALSGIELLNAAQRFQVLKRLRDDGLITDGEYAGRRAANIGVLLPFSSSVRPAEGLGRPVPTAEQVAARLDALRQSLAGGSVRPEEHFAEREAILDAILPADPRRRMAPPSPPVSLADAAERADALQRLRDMGVISKDEYGRERAALEKAAARFMTRADAAAGTVLVPKAPAKAGSGGGAKKPAPAKPAATVLVPKTDAEALAAGRAGGDPSRMVGQGPTVVAAPAATPAAAAATGPVVLHLASYKSKGAAEAGWADLRARLKALSALSPQYTEVDLGAGRGTYWRLNAGPLSDQAAAERLCGQLAAQGQYCRAAFAGG